MKRSGPLLSIATAALLCFASSAAGRPASPKPKVHRPSKPDSELEPDPPETPPGHRRVWRWKQVLSTPRIGGRMTAVSVDPRAPNRVFAGTEEGTLLRSIDRGVTWEERLLTPFVIQRRSVGSKLVDKLDFQDAGSARFSLGADPPFRSSAAGAAALNANTLAFRTFPSFFSGGFPPDISPQPPDPSLLSDVVQSREGEVVPVNSIALCANARFPLLVSTTREVYGSSDDGASSMRVFFITGKVKITQVACSRWHPEEVAVATEVGVYLSRDGGLSFNIVGTGYPGTPALSVAFALDPATRRSILYQASEEELYGGDPRSEYGLKYLYPLSPETRPYKDINYITVDEAEGLWLATDDGVRVSRDHGKSFRTVEPLLMSGGTGALGDEAKGLGGGLDLLSGLGVSETERAALQVVSGKNDWGGPRIAVLFKEAIFASDDDGKTWFPFFHGLTRRSLRQVSGGAAFGGVAEWWVVTGGELWTTLPFDDRGRSAASGLAGWAQSRLAETPPLDVAIERVLHHTRLSNELLADLVAKRRAWRLIPLFDVKLSVNDDGSDKRCGGLFSRDFIGCAVSNIVTERRRRDSALPMPAVVEGRTERPNITFLAQLTWPITEGLVFPEETAPLRNSLYELRRQIAFAAEDAWHERRAHLTRIAGGALEAHQTDILRARIEALEMVLDTWSWMRPID